VTRLLVVAVVGLGIGFLLGQRGIPQTLDEVDTLREAIEDRELTRTMSACGAHVEAAA
jgi:hypothetical protein